MDVPQHGESKMILTMVPARFRSRIIFLPEVACCRYTARNWYCVQIFMMWDIITKRAAVGGP